MKNKTKTQHLADIISDTALEFAIIACVRYSLGRRTYAVSICLDLVKAAVRRGSDKLCHALIKDILAHGEQSMGIVGDSKYGMDCDQADWQEAVDRLVTRLGLHQLGRLAEDPEMTETDAYRKAIEAKTGVPRRKRK